MATTRTPNVITLLKKDHRKVKELFEQFEGLGDRAFKAKKKIADQICEELTIHATVEEEIFYPALEALRSKETSKMNAEAHQEHALVKLLVSEIKAMEAGDVIFDAKVKVLKDLVTHHVKEEENEIFPECKDEMSEEQLQSLGEQTAARKEELMSGEAMMPTRGKRPEAIQPMN